MNFVLLLYLRPDAPALTRLEHAVTALGTAETDPPTNLAAFQHALRSGMFAAPGEDGLTSLRVSLPQLGPLADLPRLTLTLEGVFSPALHAHPPVLPAETAATLRTLHTPYVGDSGYTTALPGQPALAAAGIVVAALSGVIPWGPERAGQRDALRRFLHGWLERVRPIYAFLTNQEDFQLWHPDTMPQFPPPEPWRFVWSLMVYGADLAGRLGVSRVRSRGLPSALERVDTTPGGLVVIQPLDFLLHPNETYRIRAPEMAHLVPARQRRLDAIRQQLDLSLPYEAFG